MEETLQISPKEAFLQSLTPTPYGFADNLRVRAIQNLALLQFPTTKTEAWKYTRIGKIVNKQFQVFQDTSPMDTTPFKIEGLEADRLVFVNGFYREDLSERTIPQEDLFIQPLSLLDKKGVNLIQNYLGEKTNEETEIFTAINSAYFTDGVLIHIPKNKHIERPVHIMNILTGENTISQPRNVVIAESGSESHFVQSFKCLNGSNGFTNTVTEFFVKENAVLNWDKIQYENENTYQIGTEQVHQEGNSIFSINTITADGALVRNNLNIEIDGENCTSNLNGLYLLQGKQHVDNHTIVDHKKPHCNSNELYKGIADDSSTAVFNGKVFVRPDAQKTNAFQQNKNIVMTDGASVNSKPELEIYADDVKCSHGSTTGQFDEEAVFYLRSRGIGEESARNMLVFAFAGEVLDKLKIEPLKKQVTRLLEKRFV